MFCTFEAWQPLDRNGRGPHLADLDHGIAGVILDKGSNHLHDDHLFGAILGVCVDLMPPSLTIADEHDPVVILVASQDPLCDLQNPLGELDRILIPNLCIRPPRIDTVSANDFVDFFHMDRLLDRFC